MVRWTEPALHDLKEIFDCIAQDSRFYARQVTEAIRERAFLLGRFPHMGHVVPEMGNDRIREIISRPYRILYEVKEDHVDVLAVIHGKRDLEESLGSR